MTVMAIVNLFNQHAWLAAFYCYLANPICEAFCDANVLSSSFLYSFNSSSVISFDLYK